MTSRVARRDRLLPASSWCGVITPTCAFCASSSWLQANRPRAALHCSGVSKFNPQKSYSAPLSPLTAMTSLNVLICANLFRARSIIASRRSSMVMGLALSSKSLGAAKEAHTLAFVLDGGVADPNPIRDETFELLDPFVIAVF